MRLQKNATKKFVQLKKFGYLSHTATPTPWCTSGAQSTWITAIKREFGRLWSRNPTSQEVQQHKRSNESTASEQIQFRPGPEQAEATVTTLGFQASFKKLSTRRERKIRDRRAGLVDFASVEEIIVKKCSDLVFTEGRFQHQNDRDKRNHEQNVSALFVTLQCAYTLRGTSRVYIALLISLIRCFCHFRKFLFFF